MTSAAVYGCGVSWPGGISCVYLSRDSETTVTDLSCPPDDVHRSLTRPAAAVAEPHHN